MVVIALKRLIEWLVLFVLFFILTLSVYRTIYVLEDKINPLNNYKEPIGKSIKVVEMDQSESMFSQGQFFQRLKFFYWIGE